jgi:hypothetical protein
MMTKARIGVLLGAFICFAGAVYFIGSKVADVFEAQNRLLEQYKDSNVELLEKNEALSQSRDDLVDYYADQGVPPPDSYQPASNLTPRSSETTVRNETVVRERRAQQQTPRASDAPRSSDPPSSQTPRPEPSRGPMVEVPSTGVKPVDDLTKTLPLP